MVAQDSSGRVLTNFGGFTMAPFRIKPGVAFWATVVAVLVAYPLSFGPACWVRNRMPPDLSWPVYRAVYAPILWLYKNGPEPARRVLIWYADLWLTRQKTFRRDRSAARAPVVNPPAPNPDGSSESS